MPIVLDEIKIAVNIYAYFLSDYLRLNLEGIFKKLEEHVKNDIPEALSAPNVIYGGGQQTRNDAKELFYKYIDDLLSYAKKT